MKNYLYTWVEYLFYIAIVYAITTMLNYFTHLNLDFFECLLCCITFTVISNGRNNEL